MTDSIVTMLKTTLCVLALWVAVTLAYPNGAPDSACSSFLPLHGEDETANAPYHPASTEDFPFEIIPSSACYAAGQSVTGK